MANPNANSILTNEPGCIAGGLPYKVMRIAMENKGLLVQAGALYCGTGKSRTIEAVVKKLDGEGNEITETVLYDIPETIAVDPPQLDGVQNGVTYGIKFTLDTDNKVKSAVLVPVQPK